MAEELRKEEKKCSCGKTSLTLTKTILGLILLLLGVWAVIAWREAFLSLIKGCIGLFLILAGIITLAIAKD